MREKCPYLEIFWSTFSSIWAKYGDFLCESPHSVLMQDYASQKNPEYGHFLRRVPA